MAKTPEERAAHKALLNLKLAANTLGILIRQDPLRFAATGQMDVPVHGATITIDRGEAAKRLTLTRAALTGPLAFALKKDTTKLYITVEGVDGSALVVEVKAKKEAGARKLAVMVHGQYPAAQDKPE